ncbi:hypothetical protein JAAARDRAFT_491125 [Jaapia argillacea MUCL 33604]|uniref:Uncharacterized protein n=1 Tax=Jaapia argillacea MUCL 33604 TaxID=933084 RepID=A0A067PM37_9AGAM|nr:hypothetical protein JAAARDRAFT_491125 [Jaapia argillacea MUCL 33604]
MCGEENYKGQTVLYGIYIPIFIGCAYVCLYVRPHRYLLMAATAMFVLCTIQAILTFLTVLYTPDIIFNTTCEAGVCVSCKGDNLARANEINIQNRLGLVAIPVISVNQLITEGFLIYRAYVVWKCNIWITVIPTFALLAVIVCRFIQTDHLAHTYFAGVTALHNDTILPTSFGPELPDPLGEVSDILLMTTSVLTTILIASRIWWLTRDFDATLGKRATKKYRRAMRLM